MLKVYIMGKVTGEDPATCRQKFLKREEQLKSMGYDVVNPINLVDISSNWADAMRICITEMMQCDCVSPLSDVLFSKGGLLELNLSRMLEMTIVLPQDE